MVQNIKFRMKCVRGVFSMLALILYALHGGIERTEGIPVASPIKLTECTGEIGMILKQIRSLMIDSAALDGQHPIEAYIVPMTDAHQSEYVADQDKRLQYISKFTGSAGEAVVTIEQAALWTDSRYHLQAEQELDQNCWTLMKKGLIGVPSRNDWLISNLPVNSTVGVDPFLISGSDFKSLQNKLSTNGHELISISNNLVDTIWVRRPNPSKTKIVPLDIKYSGKNASQKVVEVLDEVKKAKAESIVVKNLDDIAWLLNLRGSDIEYNPLFFSYVLLSPLNSHLFVDRSKLTETAKKHLDNEFPELIILDYTELIGTLKEIVSVTTGKILTTTDVSQAIRRLIPDERHVEQNIVADMKAVKNTIEAENMEKAHIRDGLAVVQYLHWLNSTIDKQNVTELSGAKKLSHYRAQQENFRGLSFSVISAVGENAANPHYHSTPESNKQITREDLYMVDSGGQYWDGTTDITRTVHFGIPSEEQKKCFTRVLKGFIAFVTSVFPPQTPLSYMDHVARRALWQAGLNYGHGTGHGVGMYLSVHEYPPAIGSTGSFKLKENVFTSNEPGFYKPHHFGMRLEDVIQVIKSDIKDAFEGQGGLTFKSITYVPLQTKLIDIELLTKEEFKYVNKYNQKVLETIGPILLKHRLMDTYRWLQQETQAINS